MDVHMWAFQFCKVEYFNNYLRDPRRPQLPEHPSSKPSTGSQPAPAREPYMPPTSFHGPLPPPPPVSYRPAPYAGESSVWLTCSMYLYLQPIFIDIMCKHIIL